jgi:hypothetical protein
MTDTSNNSLETYIEFFSGPCVFYSQFDEENVRPTESVSIHSETDEHSPPSDNMFVIIMDAVYYFVNEFSKLINAYQGVE